MTNPHAQRALEALELIRKALIKADKEQGLSLAELEAFETIFEALTDAIDGGWRPISEVPRDGTEVEIWSKYACHIGYSSYTKDEKIAPSITHFRAKTPPPSPATEQGET